jgi:hypothetical protein
VFIAGALLPLRAQEAGVPAELEVRSVPAGAEVLLDGKPLGFTPIRSTEIRPGRRRVTLRYRGYEAHEEWLFLPAGERTEHTVNLVPLSRTVTFTSDSPLPLEVFLQGQWRDAASVILPAGTHNLRFRSYGYAEVQQTVTVSSPQDDDAGSYHIELSPLDVQTINVETSGHAIVTGRSSPYRPGVLKIETAAPRRVTVQITGQAGNYRYEDSFVSRDRTTLFFWNGRTTDGDPMPPGSYTVEAISAAGPGADGSVVATTTIKVLEWSETSPFVLGGYGTGTSLFPLPGSASDVPAMVVTGGGVDSTGRSSGFLAASLVPWGGPVVSARMSGFADTGSDALSSEVSGTVESPEIGFLRTDGLTVTIAPGLTTRLRTAPGEDSFSGSVSLGTALVSGGVGLAVIPLGEVTFPRSKWTVKPGVGSSLYFRRGRFFTALSGKTVLSGSPSVAFDVAWYPLSGPSGLQFSLVMDNPGGRNDLSGIIGVGVGLK